MFPAQVNEIPAQKASVTGAPYTTGPGLRKTDSEIVNMKKKKKHL